MSFSTIKKLLFLICFSIIIIHYSSYTNNLNNYYNRYNAYNKFETITFGKYEQDADITNGKEAIEWLVLDVKDNKILLISKYILDCKQYYYKDSLVYWENSYIRNWLNSNFLYSAFDENEITEILDTYNVNNTNLYTNEYSGENTLDKVFILSLDEAISYFDFYGNDLSVSVNYGLNKNSLRQCKGTEYAIKNNLRVVNNDSELNKCGNYWLRTVGLNELRIWYSDKYANYYNTYVRENGSINEKGTCVRSNDDGIRPCIWVRR